jgi:hypothetical protein
MDIRFRVSFDVKNSNNLLIEQQRNFASLKTALIYIKSLQAGNVNGWRLVGKPIIERI